MEIQYIKIKQNDSSFFICNIPAKFIYQNCKIVRASENPDGIQRWLDPKRVDDIAKYCEDSSRKTPLFLTPIVVSLNSDYIDGEISKDDPTGSLNLIDPPHHDMFDIIDGQHRLLGIKRYEEEYSDENSLIELPVSIILDADAYQSADIFLRINSNQKPVDWSTMYSLFGLMEKKSGKPTVQSFASKVVYILNNNESSPFHNKIKMFGRKTQKDQFISQATIGHKISDNIWLKSSGEKRTLTEYYQTDQYLFVAKIIMNIFNAFKTRYKEAWDDKHNMVKKAVGFSAIMRLLMYILPEQDDLTQQSFEQIFSNIDHNLDNEKTTGDLFYGIGSSESEAKKVSEKLIDAYKLSSEK